MMGYADVNDWKRQHGIKDDVLQKIECFPVIILWKKHIMFDVGYERETVEAFEFHFIYPKDFTRYL